MIERWVEAKLYKSDLIPNFWVKGGGRLKSAEAKYDSAIAKQTDDLFPKGCGGWLQRVVPGSVTSPIGFHDGQL